MSNWSFASLKDKMKTAVPQGTTTQPTQNIQHVSGSKETLTVDPTIAQLLDENKKLKMEKEVLEEHKNQNHALKESIATLVQEADKLKVQLTDAQKQIESLKSNPQPNTIPPSSSSTSEPTQPTAAESTQETQELESRIREIESKHVAEITSIETKYKELIAQQSDEISKLRDTQIQMNEKYKNDMSTVETRYTDIIASQKQELDKIMDLQKLSETKNSRIEELEKVLGQYKVTITDFETQSATKDGLISQYQQQIQELSSQINAVSSQLLQSNSQLSTLEKKLESEKSEHQTIIASKQIEIDNLKQLASGTGDVQATLEAVEKNYSDLIGSLKMQLKESNEVEVKSRLEITTLTDRNNELEEKLRQMVADVGQVNAKISSLESELNENQRKMEAMESRYKEELGAAESRVQDQLKERESEQQSIVASHQSELKLKNDAINDLESKLANLQIELKQTQSLYEESRKNESTLRQEISTLQSQMDQTRKELEIKHQTETDLIKSQQLSEIQSIRSEHEKQLQLKFDEFTTERNKLEERTRHLEKQLEQNQSQLREYIDSNGNVEKKVRADLEKKFKKEKETLGADLDKARKDLIDIQKSKNEEVSSLKKEISSKNDEVKGLNHKISLLEKDVINIREIHTKQIDEWHKKKDDFEKAIAESARFKAEETSLREKIASLTSKSETVAAELDVSKAAYERVSKQLSEREAELKSLRSADSNKSINIRRLEQDLAEMQTTVKDFKDKLTTTEQKLVTVEAERQRIAKEIEETSVKAKSTEDEITRLREENTQMNQKVSDLEHEIKIVERKGSQMVKDLQRQLLRERNRTSISAQGTAGSVESLTPSHDYTPHHKRQASHEVKYEKSASRSSSDMGSRKTPTDIMSMIQENESMTKRLADLQDAKWQLEEQTRQLNEKMSKLQEDNDNKSKTIQQYILRDNQVVLQTTPKSSSSRLGLSAMSSSKAVSTMDPALLAEINNKLQKLLEETTIKNMQLQDDVKNLSDQLYQMKQKK